MQRGTLEDRELVERALEGDERAFEELLRRYERPVFSLIFRIVRDRTVAEDLAQEAFIRVFRALDRYDPDRRFSAWMFRIAHNVTIDHLRKAKPETLSIDGAPGEGPADSDTRPGITLTSPLESPADFVENRELGGRIEEAIGQLRPDYRTAILLRHVEGYAYEEVAEIMDIPLGTAKTYIHRARGELRRALAGVTT